MNTTTTSTPTFDISPNGLLFNFAKGHPEEFSQTLNSTPSKEAYRILDSLPTLVRVEVLAFSARLWAMKYIQTKTSDDIVEWMNRGSIDTVIRLARRIPEDLRKEIVRKIKDGKKVRAIQRYVRFAKNTVATVADKDFVSFREDETCSSVIRQLRELELEESENVLILSLDERVLGLVDETKLIRSGKHEPIKSCVLRTALLPANAPVQAVIELEDWHRIDRLPVVDRGGIAVGILRWTQVTDYEVTPEDIEEESSPLVVEILNTLFDVAKSLSKPVSK